MKTCSRLLRSPGGRGVISNRARAPLPSADAHAASAARGAPPFCPGLRRRREGIAAPRAGELHCWEKCRHRQPHRQHRATKRLFGKNAGTASPPAAPDKGFDRTSRLPNASGNCTPRTQAGAQDRRAVTDATRTEGRGGPREPGLGHPKPLCGSISAPAPCGARRQSVQVFVPCFMEREVSFWRWGKNASIDSSLQAGHSV